MPGLSVLLEQSRQPFHILLHRGFIGLVAGQAQIIKGYLAISRRIQPGFELLLVAGRIMGKTIGDQLTALLLSV